MKKLLASAVLFVAAGLDAPANAAEILMKVCHPEWNPQCRNYPPVTTAVPLPSATLAPSPPYSLTFDNLSRDQVEFILNAINADKSRVDLSPRR
jgi:hypothetical protein